MSAAPAGLLADLAAAGELVTDPDVLEGYRSDQAAPGLLAAGRPAALVRPRTTAHVQAAVRAAGAHGAPIVPRGAGSGLSGGANAIDGCVIVCLEAMTGAVVDAPAMTVTARAGTVNAAVKAAAAAEGLFYAPDPASYEFSTIGGNVATNAGGLCCVRHGVTRDAVLGLEVVLADGRAVRLGRRTRKGVAGYDLTALLCGSEGTLGIVTEVTARLLPAPAPQDTLAASFADLDAAARAVARIVRTQTPSLLELMDRATIAAVEDMQPMGLDRDVAVLVFAQADRPGSAITALADLCEQEGATLVVTSEDEAEGRMLMAARRLAYPALERRGATLLDDVAVPLDRLPALLEGVAAIATRERLLIGTFGHAGDGNMHPTIVYDRGDAEEVVRARRAFDAILALAGDLGGTCTGEHGVGALKLDAMRAELGDAYDVHRAVRTALDPAGVFNPGRGI